MGTPTLANTDFIVISNNEHIAIYDSTNGTWNAAAVDMSNGGSAPTDKETSFYFADAALRCYNPNFDTNVKSTWFGHINRTLFGDSTHKDYNAWYYDTTKLLAPSDITAGTGYSRYTAPGKL